MLQMNKMISGAGWAFGTGALGILLAAATAVVASAL
jgi:hypothetical protein